MHVLPYNFTWWSQWTRKLKVRWIVVGLPMKNQSNMGEPPNKKGINFIDSWGTKREKLNFEKKKPKKVLLKNFWCCFKYTCIFKSVFSFLEGKVESSQVIYLETSGTSMMELSFFAKIVNGYKLLPIFTEKLHRRCLAELQIRLC